MVVKSLGPLRKDPSVVGKLFALYAALHAIRALMLILLWPVVRHSLNARGDGYHYGWPHGVAMVWGGLRGAVGLT